MLLPVTLPKTVPLLNIMVLFVGVFVTDCFMWAGPQYRYSYWEDGEPRYWRWERFVLPALPSYRPRRRRNRSGRARPGGLR